MKIVILTSEFPPGPGGIGDHAYNLAEQLVEKKFDVTVITEFREEFNSQWNDLRSSANVKYAKRGRGLSNLGFVLLFLRYFLGIRNATWIATGSKSLALLGICIFLFRRKSLAILHGHEMVENHGIKSRVNKYVLKYFTRIVAVSEFSRDNSKRYVAGREISVIPNGFNQIKYGVLPVLKSDRTENLNLITVGRISRRKGQHNVIKSLPLIIEKYPSVMYHMVGINDESINSLIDNYNVKNHVRIYGVLTDKEMAKLFQQADIFLMLSENVEGDVEGFGIAIIEANFFGIPAIGSLGCGVEQAIKDGYNGRLVNGQDTEEISNAIITILSDYKSFSLRSIEWARMHLWSKKIDEYVKILS